MDFFKGFKVDSTKLVDGFDRALPDVVARKAALDCSEAASVPTSLRVLIGRFGIANRLTLTLVALAVVVICFKATPAHAITGKCYDVELNVNNRSSTGGSEAAYCSVSGGSYVGPKSSCFNANENGVVGRNGPDIRVKAQNGRKISDVTTQGNCGYDHRAQTTWDFTSGSENEVIIRVGDLVVPPDQCTNYGTDRSCAVSVNFVDAPIVYRTVQINSSAGVTTTPSGNGQVPDGERLYITPTYAPGYRLDSVSGTCGGEFLNGQYRTDVITQNCSVTISAKRDFTVTTSAGSGGAIYPGGSTLVGEGESFVATLRPDEGYEIAGVSGSCNGSLSGDRFTVPNVSASCSIEGSFSALPIFSVTTSVTGSGTISPASAQNVYRDETVSYVLTPSDYTQELKSIGGTCGGALEGLVYTTNPVTENCIVEPVFGPRETYQVTLSSTGAGELSLNSPISVLSGDVIEFEMITYSEGVGVLDINSSCGGGREGRVFTTDPIASNCSVSVTFGECTLHTVTASASSGGSISPASKQVCDGDQVELLLTPDTGFEVTAITGTCGGEVVAGDTNENWSYRTTPITGDCSVAGVFDQPAPRYSLGLSDTYACVTDDTGVRCWTWSSQPTEETLNAASAPQLSNVLAVATSAFNRSCAATSDGVTCWGDTDLLSITDDLLTDGSTGEIGDPSKLINFDVADFGGFMSVCYTDGTTIRPQCAGQKSRGHYLRGYDETAILVSNQVYHTCAIGADSVFCRGGHFIRQSIWRIRCAVAF